MAGTGDERKRRDREKHRRRAVICQPLRREIGRLLAADDREAGALELAAELELSPGLVGYHLRVLARNDVIGIVADRGHSPPVYRWSPRAQWARKMLGEGEE